VVSKKENEVLVFACDGASNTGKLAGAVALRLVKSGGFSLACLPALALDRESLLEKIKSAEKLIAVDGCAFRCAEKIIKGHARREPGFSVELSSEYRVKKDTSTFDVDEELVASITQDLLGRIRS